jgi:signal transduction histidine kinase/ActR/RegA family two-component response regulator
MTMLAEAGLRAAAVRDVPQLVEELRAGAGFAIVTEEALTGTDLRPLSVWLGNQPEWSDMPFVLLTQRGGGLERNPSARRYLNVLGNVTFLERPFHPTTLISFAQSALRGRRRQYEARARLQELKEFADGLEQRVADRTAEHTAAVAQLHEVQKMETLGQLTGGVAHDFNNLLTPITGALDLLEKQYADSDPRAGRLLRNALKASDRARILVQRLLGFARRQALQTRPIDIGRLVRGMHDLIASSVGPTIEIKIEAEDDQRLGMVDPNQLELAILNLTVNGRDAMPDGGTLTISIAPCEVSKGTSDGTGPPPGNYICLTVTDTGSGMTAETLARAVEPFFSTKDVGRGTGLGLSMVHGLTAQLGGGFKIASAPGQGTSVEMYLPVASSDSEVVNLCIKDLPASSDRVHSVLLVDDEEIVRVATAEMIRELGHEVVEAASGSEALGLLESGLQVDVLITDYKMPRMDGTELARLVKDIQPEIAVLLITGYTGASKEVGNYARLDKPFGQREIRAAFAELFGHSHNVLPFPDGSRSADGHQA